LSDGEAHGSTLTGRLLIIAAVFFWGISAVFARFLFRDRAIPPFHLVELRILLALPILIAWIAWRNPDALRPPREDRLEFIILGAIGVAAIQGTYYYSISVLGVGLSILMQYLAPALIVGWEMLRGVRPRPLTVATLVIAVLGTALLVGSLTPVGREIRPEHWLVAFSSALTFAFYVVYSKRMIGRHPPERVLLYSFLTAAVIWLIVTPPWRIIAAGYSAKIWMGFVTMAVISVALPFVCFNVGLRRMPASRAGILSMLEPVIAIVGSALALGEGLAPRQWAGAVLVLLASGLAARRHE
jgi:drug/metabolite transporter (DMT)-like permease